MVDVKYRNKQHALLNKNAFFWPQKIIGNFLSYFSVFKKCKVEATPYIYIKRITKRFNEYSNYQTCYT